MSVEAVVDIAARVVRLARTSPDGEAPQVTPVRVTDLGVAMDILGPVLRQLGGIALDIGRIAEHGCSDTHSDQGQEAAISAALRHTSSGGNRELVFDEDENGRRRAFWADERGAGAQSPSVHPLLGLATATIDERLTDSTGIVISSYDEAQLDPTERPVAWYYATKVMPHRFSGTPAHVVVLVGAETPSDYQLRGDPSLRWSADGIQVAQRNLAATNRSLTQRLAAVTESHVVLFLAAGFSSSMDLPLGNTMRDFALRKLLPDRGQLPDHALPTEFYKLVADQHQLLDFEEYEDPLDLAKQLTFERVLQQELQAFHPSPTLRDLADREASAVGATPRGAVRHLHSMLPRDRKLVLITVNFDRLIENGQEDRVEVFSDDASFRGCAGYVDRYLDDRESKIPLLKLHGSFGAPDTLVASIEQTLTGLTTDKVESLDRACRKSGPVRVPFIYVGSSMRDLDLGPYLSQTRFATQLDEHWVMPLAPESVVQFVQRHRVQPWKTAGASDSLVQRAITWTADEFFDELARYW